MVMKFEGCQTVFIYFFELLFSRCIDYQNIPSGCHAETKPGQCCPDIVCPHNQVIVPSTTNILQMGGGNGINVGTKPIVPHVYSNGTIDLNNYGVHLPSISEFI